MKRKMHIIRFTRLTSTVIARTVVAGLLTASCIGSAHAETSSVFSSVQRQVNRTMVYRLSPQSDPMWSGEMTYPCPVEGDCKNFALCKCWRLHQWRIACEVVIYWEPAAKDYHAVAVAGGWVLDSMRQRIRPWSPPGGGWWARIPAWERDKAPVAGIGMNLIAKETATVGR